MKESAFKFGKYESLVGIISDPFVDPNNGPAVIILSYMESDLIACMSKSQGNWRPSDLLC